MEILYQDGEIAVCVKPVGMDSEKEVPQALSALLKKTVYPVHRLDLNVGGVMVYALTKTAAAELSRQIAEGKMIKEYVAQVKGTPPQSGTWEDFLFKDSRKNKVFAVKKQRAGVKKAKLAYGLLEAGEYSLVHIRLFTGRSHQIRVQFASRGYPLLGDHKYGARDEEKAPRLFSCRIYLHHHGQQMVFTKLPDFMGNRNLEDFSWEQN